MTSQRYRATYKMADMRYYGNVMTTRWRLYVILHLQQYSRRLDFFFLKYLTNAQYTISSRPFDLFGLHISCKGYNLRQISSNKHLQTHNPYCMLDTCDTDCTAHPLPPNIVMFNPLPSPNGPQRAHDTPLRKPLKLI